MAQNQANFGINFQVNKSGLEQIKASLNSIKKMSSKDLLKTNPDAIKTLDEANKILERIQTSANEVNKALNKAFNTNLGTVNISKFNEELNKLDLKKIYQDFNDAGSIGQSAFRSIATELLTANTQLKQTHSFLNNITTTLGNTIKWNVASSAMNALTDNVQRAYSYVKNLDSSLTDIRIVTGASADQMADFAEKANSAAKALGQTTRSYTDASLIYYQQGLSEADVEARTQTTLKAANVTGQSTEEVSELLTSVWNGYKVSAAEAELYIDKIAAVATTTASDLEELSVGMSKVASAASLMGVDIDQLNAQLATIVSVTRQAPESVGTALKTIYARMGDIEAGLDGETTLGNYTEKMKEMGFNVLDAQGKLRDMGGVIEEIGGKWSSMSREQQLSLAQTVAGTRQYNNLLALFDNWDMYTSALNTSSEAMGTLQEQNDTFMEGTEAHLKQMTASFEDLYDSILDADAINDVSTAISKITDAFTQFIDGIGGGSTILTSFGALGLKIFSKDIAQGITTSITNFNSVKENAALIQSQVDLANKLNQVEDENVKKLSSLKSEALLYSDIMDDGQRETINSMIQIQNQLMDQKQSWIDNAKAAEKFFNRIAKEDKKIGLLDDESDKEKIDLGSKNSVLLTEDAEALKIYKDSLNYVIEETKNYDKTVLQLNETLNNLSKVEATADYRSDEYTEAMNLKIKATEEYREVMTSLMSQLESGIYEGNYSDETASGLYKLMADYRNALRQSGGEITSDVDQAAKKVIAAAKQAAQAGIVEAQEAEKIIRQAMEGMEEDINDAMRSGENAVKKFFKVLKDQRAIKGFLDTLGGISSILAANQSISELVQSVSEGETTIIEGLSSILFATTSAVNGFQEISQGVNALTVAFRGAEHEGKGLVDSLHALTGLPTKLIRGVGIATTAVMALVTAYQHWEKAQQQARQENMKLGEEAANEGEEIRNLKRAYEDALTIYQQTGEGKEALLTATSNLSVALGLEAAYLTDAKDAWNEYSDSILEAQEQAARSNKIILNAARESADEELVSAASKGMGNFMRSGTTMFKNFGALSTEAEGADEILNILKEQLGDNLTTSPGERSRIVEIQLKTGKSGADMYLLAEKINEAYIHLSEAGYGQTLIAKELQATYTDIIEEVEAYGKAVDNETKNILDFTVAAETLNGTLKTPTNEDELKAYRKFLEDTLKDEREVGNLSSALTDETITEMVNDYTASLSREIEKLSQDVEVEATITTKVDPGSRSAVEEYIDTLDERVIDVVVKTVWEGSTIEDIEAIVKATALDEEIRTIENNATTIHDIVSQLLSGDLESLDSAQIQLVNSALEWVDGIHEGVSAAQEWQEAVGKGSFVQSQFLMSLLTEGKLVDGLIDKKIELNKQNTAIAEAEKDATIKKIEETERKQKEALEALKTNDEGATNLEGADLHAYALEHDEVYQGLQKDLISYQNEVTNCILTIDQLKAELDGLELQQKVPQMEKVELTAEYDALLNQRAETLSGLYSRLAAGNTSSEDYSLLAELEGLYPTLAQAAEESGRKSEEYLNTVKEIQLAEYDRIQTEKNNNQTRLSNIQSEIDAQKKALEQQKENLEFALNGGRIPLSPENKSVLQDELNNVDAQLAATKQADQRATEVSVMSDFVDTSYLEDSVTTFRDLNNLFERGVINAEQFTNQTAELFNLEPRALETEIALLKELNPDLEDNLSLLTDMAKANLRCERGTKDLVDVWEDYNKAIKSWQRNGKKIEDATEDITDNTETVEEAFKDLFDLTEEEFNLLPEDFVRNHHDELNEVVRGTEGAYENLQEIVQDELVYRIALDHGYADAQAQELVGKMNEIQSMMDGMEIKAGVAIDDTEFIAACNNMVQAAGLTEGAITALFDSMNCDVQFTDAPAEIDNDPQYADYYVPATYATSSIIPTGGESGVSGAVREATVVTPGHFEKANQGDIQTVKPGARAIQTITPRGTGKGGNISRKAASPSGGGGGGKKGGGGGGGGGSAAKAAKPRKKDYYHNVNNSLKKLTSAYDKVAEAQDKAFGKQHINNLKKINKNLDSQIEKMRERIKIANEQEKVDLKKDITSQYSEVQFNKDGTIANYEEVLAKYYAAYSNTGQSKEAQDEAKEKYDRLKELLDEYETLILETIPEWEAEIREKINEKYENMTAQFEYEITMRTDWGESIREYKEFKHEFGDFTEDLIAQSTLAYNTSKSFFDSKELTSRTRQLNDALGELEKINSALKQGKDISKKGDEEFFSDIWGDNKQGLMDYIATLQTDLMDNLLAISDARNEAYDNYLEAIDEGISKMDEHLDQYKQLTDELDHNRNLIELIYGEESDKIGDVYKAQHKVNVESLKGHQLALANYQKQADIRRKQLEEEAKNSHTRSVTGAVQTTDRYKEIEEELKYYEDAIKETEATIRDTTTSSIENIIALYEYNVSQMFKNLNTKNLGFGLSEAQTQWDLLNKEAEQYLDTMNTTFEVQKLESKFVDALNKTDNLKSQERIKTVMDEQLRILEEKDKVSQYDVDRANLIYDLTLKQIALEEAQQNKSKMRLRRDAQGNYSYQFSADADLIKQTQQELLDVQQQLYNLDKNEYKNQLDIMAGYYEEWQNKLQEVALIKDAEERERTAAMVNDYYTRLIENAANQSQVAEENLENLLNGPLADFKAGNEEIADEIKTMYDSAFATMADNFAQEGGVADTIKQAWAEISDAAKDYLKQLKEISKVSKDSFGSLEDPSKIVEGVEQITAATKDLNKAWNATLKSLKSLFTKIDKFLDSPEIKAAIEALTKSESKEKSEKKKAGDAAEKANKEAVAEKIQAEVIKKEPTKPATPPKKEEPKKKEVKVGGQINAKGAYIYTYINKGRNTQLFASDPNYTVLKMQDGWVQVRHHKARPGVIDGWFKQSDVTALKSGGYTGNWNSEEGRLAFLHQKELVLNQRDTRNILDAVNIIRGLSGLLQNSMINRIEGLTQSLNNISIPTVQANVETQPQSIEQTVHITAEFPGATEAIQIETALNSLVNRASQYANRKE